jgi:hypothetical protein
MFNKEVNWVEICIFNKFKLIIAQQKFLQTSFLFFLLIRNHIRELEV